MTCIVKGQIQRQNVLQHVTWSGSWLLLIPISGRQDENTQSCGSPCSKALGHFRTDSWVFLFFVPIHCPHICSNKGISSRAWLLSHSCLLNLCPGRLLSISLSPSVQGKSSPASQQIKSSFPLHPSFHCLGFHMCCSALGLHSSNWITFKRIWTPQSIVYSSILIFISVASIIIPSHLLDGVFTPSLFSIHLHPRPAGDYSAAMPIAFLLHSASSVSQVLSQCQIAGIFKN